MDIFYLWKFRKKNINAEIYECIIYIYILFQIVHGVHIEPAHEVKKRSINQPLRILLFYDDSVYRQVFHLLNLYAHISYKLINASYDKNKQNVK